MKCKRIKPFVFLLIASLIFSPILFSSYIFKVSAAETDGLVIENGVLVSYNGTAKDILLPSGVKEISSYVFANNHTLRSIILNEDLTSIGDCAFSGCTNLTSITIPSQVTSIGSSAFNNCTSLKSASLPEGLTVIANSLFCGCTSLSELHLPDTITLIDDYAFLDTPWLGAQKSSKPYVVVGHVFLDGTKVTGTFQLPDHIYSIASYAFSGNKKIICIKFTPDLVTIGDEAFYNCKKLNYIIIPKNVLNYGAHCFTGTAWIKRKAALKKPVIVNGTLINGDCYGKTATLTTKVNKIAPYALETNKKIKKLILPCTITKLDRYMLAGCESLTTLTFSRALTEVDSNAFIDTYYLKQLILPSGIQFQINGTLFDNDDNCYLWSSSENNVLQISTSGTVTALKPGTCSLTLHLEEERKMKVVIM